MSGFKSFSQNTTDHANVIKAQSNEHTEVNSPTDSQPSQVPGTIKDVPENNEQPDPNNK
ncbi:hypothetical protein [Acinetobacter sp. NIPH 2100]|uniref:hypothetical protein n=1 Tax=Acinetobacter sp. NIPH 2100 TaxID=1217708 RepID=UPI0002D078CA|nr:hypothetical protein [Acinetobacter sp. NIPH 2100]ENX42810.1 hypothetical protein F887_00979 [Acinetobacter sp. NIPH 2100]